MSSINDSGTRLAVFADLDLQVTAPDGSAARVRVTDRAGELVVDIERPVTVLKSLPMRVDLRSLVRGGGPLRTSFGSAAGQLPPIRLRTGGLTVAVARNGRLRPGAAVAVPLLAVPIMLGLTAVAVLIVAVTRRQKVAGQY